MFHEGPMTERKLSHAARDHVDQNLLISDYFGGGFNKIGFHNLVLTSTRHQRRIDFGAQRRLTFLLLISSF
jgi:hypothetical protein